MNYVVVINNCTKCGFIKQNKHICKNFAQESSEIAAVLLFAFIKEVKKNVKKQGLKTHLTVVY